MNIIPSTRHPNQRKESKNTDLQHQKTKCPIFAYSRKEKTRLTKLFKETQLKVAF
jgi:hypothetical protein